jgi:C-3',4' desaturase CrtD
MRRRGFPARAPRIVVIGAGIGGLTAAALLADEGYTVTVLEAGTYPGGSAGTFFHQGFRYEAGATLAGGFQPGGPHALVGERLGIEWPVQAADPGWVVHLPDRVVTLSRENHDVRVQFPIAARFWDEQTRIADQVWALAAQGLPWPPVSAAELVQLLRVGLVNMPGDLGLLPFALRTARQWLAQHNVLKDVAFVRLIDAQLLIAAQTTSAYANALYSATALDLARQGLYHVVGGIGGLAQTLAEAIRERGGQVHYQHRVTGLDVTGGRVTRIHALRQSRQQTVFEADFVIANLTPWSLDALLGNASPVPLRHEAAQRELGWGAFVLYLGVKADALPRELPDHHQIVTGMHGPLGEGRSVFVSLSPAWDTTRAPDGYRAATVTTHTMIQPWWDLISRDHAAYEARKDDYTDRLLGGIERAIPGFGRAVVRIMPGTPVTHHTWTHRHLGMVGGFPQVSLFKARGPRTGLPNLRLVGDSIFPGQSTAGVTLGALRVANDVRRSLPRATVRTVSIAQRGFSQ